MTINLSTPQEFSPELGSRRTEYILWGAISLFIGLAIFIPGYIGKLTSWSWVLILLFVFVAAAISLNNWNLRNIKLVLSSNSIEHKSKLRNLLIKWEEIEQVRITPGKFGDKIVVNSKNSTFFFDTLGELKIKGEVKEKSGFEQGEAILLTILENAGFTEKDKIQNVDYFYYSKK